MERSTPVKAARVVWAPRAWPAALREALSEVTAAQEARYGICPTQAGCGRMSSGCQIVVAKDVPRWVMRHGPGLRGPLNTELLYHHLVCPAAWVFLDVAPLAEIRPGTLPRASRDAR